MASEKKLDKILDEFESSIKDLGVITTPNVVVYDKMPDIDSIRLTEGFRIILIHNHNITRSLDEENVALQRQIEEAKPLLLEPTPEKEEKTIEPVDNTYTYPQNNTAQQIIDSIQYFTSLQEFSNNTKNLSKESITLIKLHLIKLIKQLEKKIRTKVAIDPLADTDRERLQLMTYKEFLDELTLEQDIIVEAEEKKEHDRTERIILLPHGQNSTYILEDIQNYPESYNEIYLALENILSKKFLGSKSIKSIKDKGDKLYEYTRTNGIRVLFIKRGNDIYICSLFYKDKQRSTKITAYYDEAIKRFNTFMSTCESVTSPDFEIEQKELIGLIYSEIEPSQILTLKKDGE